MKHLISTTLLLLALLFPVLAFAHDFEVNGIYYKKSGTNAIVTYKGAYYSQYSDEYTGNVNIPSSVTYSGTTYTVTSIGEYAFYYCSGLTSVTIPNSVTSIGRSAFYGCSSLTSVTIPNSVTSIGGGAFQYCESLTSMTIPNSVTTIGRGVFAGCIGLTNIIVANGNTKYDSRDNCNAIIESASNTVIAGCQSTIIPNSVTTIDDRAFYGCSGLTSIHIPNSVTSIGSSAFDGCSGLTSIHIPNSVMYIGRTAFSGCSSLANIEVANGNRIYDSRENCNAIIETVSNTLIVGCQSTIIPNTVTSIGEYAFYHCTGLTSITIPNSVSSIGISAFSYCTALETLNFNAEFCDDFFIEDYIEDLGIVFYRTNISTINIGDEVKRIPANFALDLSTLTSVTIGNSVTEIGCCAFQYCFRLTSIDIPNSVTEIGLCAFNCCSGLTSVTIGNSVTSIGVNAFSGCSSLTCLAIPNSVIEIGQWAFSGCNSLTSMTIGNSVTSIGYEAFEGCSSLTCLAIPNSVIEIGQWAFSGCSSLSSVTVASGNSVFDSRDNCNAIIETAKNTLIVGCKNTVIPNSVTCIGEDAFSCRIGLTSVIIPNSVNTIGDWAFYDCSDLNEVYSYILDPSQITMGSYVFYRNSQNYDQRTLYVPMGSLAAYQADTEWSDYFGNIVEMNYGNYLSMPDTTVFRGDTIVIPVAMTNEANIISFQTDIFLPEGLELLKEDGEYMIDPSDRMTRTHSIMSDDVSNGAIRVLCYSSNYKPFTGNSGDDLFYFTVKVADNAEDDYTIRLNNTLLTTSDFEEIAAPDVAANVHVKSCLLGDANNSGTVTVTDVVVTSQYILEQNPQPFVFRAADVNADGSITVTDVSRIVYLALNSTLDAPMRAPALWNNGDRLCAEGITLTTGETRRVSILLDNEMDYSAFQFDLKLPDGLTASNFQLTDRASNHAFDVNTLKNGNIRALCYSPALTGINGHEGALLTFDVTATSNVNGNILVDGIELVTTTCQTVKLAAFNIAVNAPSSVNELANGKTIARVDYFNLAGQQLSEPRTGVNLVVTTYTDGTRTTTKLIKK